jgi:hypothetical protein
MAFGAGGSRTSCIISPFQALLLPLLAIIECLLAAFRRDINRWVGYTRSDTWTRPGTMIPLTSRHEWSGPILGQLLGE